MEDAISKSVGQLYDRKLSIFQKSIILNAKVLSKCWYVSHVFPLPQDIAKRINKCIFKYLWNGNYQPINRKTLYLPRWRGGCGIVDVLCKSKAICFNTFYKGSLNKVFGYEVMMYYCQLRGSYLLGDNQMKDTSVISTPYHNDLIDMLRVVIKIEFSKTKV